MPKPITAAIVGAGHRSLTYAGYAQEHPEQLRIVAVADPDPVRRQMAASRFNIASDRQFETAEELAQRPQLADAVINGTMDSQHVATAVPLLEAGYHMLLEKPVATSEGELWQLAAAAKRTHRKLMVCHVLRYAPFYQAVYQQVRTGVLGEILNLQTVEHVSYHHMAVGFVHGKWNRQDRGGSSLLLAKCCHDLDLLVWLKGHQAAPRQVSSFGARQFFREEHAPPESGTRCLVDCPLEASCTYSARKLYLNHPQRWAFYVWGAHEDASNPGGQLSSEDQDRLLREDSPFGRCIWKCDNDVVDHQSVLIQYADGATATHNLIGGASRPTRTLHILGSEGELQGCFEDARFTLRRPDPRPGHEYAQQVIDTSAYADVHGAGGGHGGGDLRLVADFLDCLHDRPTDGTRTSLEQSLLSHLVGFRADAAMQQGCIQQVPLPQD